MALATKCSFPQRSCRSGCDKRADDGLKQLRKTRLLKYASQLVALGFCHRPKATNSFFHNLDPLRTFNLTLDPRLRASPGVDGHLRRGRVNQRRDLDPDRPVNPAPAQPGAAKGGRVLIPIQAAHQNEMMPPTVME